MSDDEQQQPTGPGFVKFRLQCPNCNQGSRARARMGARDYLGHDGKPAIVVGASYVPETCTDCQGTGFLALGSEEWKGRREPDPSAD
ncbi:hypothetical protein [Kitasatospora sp. GAS204B]|uniref:hypothetical protein n=1 Tax=unclassified Kitasatospora TaxID=2633591 RepID=UPI0024751945|nr:hypothetical protein [Kitasatospora sp. GAS204B]MDH6120647.1 hypothetical protein [Kitasatospora sp. GAS204B]